MPLRYPQSVLDFEEIVTAIAGSGFSGPLTLEYLPQFHDQLVADALVCIHPRGRRRSFTMLLSDDRTYRPKAWPARGGRRCGIKVERVDSADEGGIQRRGRSCISTRLPS